MHTFDLSFFLELIALGFIIACLELCFQYFMCKNMIFYPYAVLLSWTAFQNQTLNHLTRPLGRCRYCNAVWIAFYVYQYIYGTNIMVLFLFAIAFFFIWILSSTLFKGINPSDYVDKKNNRSYTESTSWQAMLKSYVILLNFYALVYLLPLIL